MKEEQAKDRQSAYFDNSVKSLRLLLLVQIFEGIFGETIVVPFLLVKFEFHLRFDDRTGPYFFSFFLIFNPVTGTFRLNTRYFIRKWSIRKIKTMKYHS